MPLHVDVAVVGGGPAGLMAAEGLAGQGLRVAIFDAMPSVSRKFLLAGKGGMNLTHSEPAERLAARYGAAQPWLAPMLQRWGGEQVRAWAAGLGVETFVGTSGRVFPSDMKAAPLLRAWVHRLRGAGVQFHMRHRWCATAAALAASLEGGAGGGAGVRTLLFDTPEGRREVQACAVVLALGGGSWSRLGSDGAWVPWLRECGVAVAPLRPANCGFDAMGREGRGWTLFFRERFAGQPFKSAALAIDLPEGGQMYRKGEFVATATGVEGSLVYAFSAALRDAIEREGRATMRLDLLPAFTPERVLAEVKHPRGSRSMSAHLKSRLGLEGIKSAVLHELLPRETFSHPEELARSIKALPLVLTAPRPIDEAISSAGGVQREAFDDHLMLRALPGVFVAGEMLDWEAPTGGYLLTGCFSTGRQAAQGVLHWMHQKDSKESPPHKD